MQRIHVTIRPLNREDSVLYFPPEAFGPFRVLHQIGAGTLGPVFRAYEPADDRRDRLVAVKVFRLDLTPEQAAGLVTELDALVTADIRHPNIAAPIAAGLEHGTAYLALEYAVGDSLDVVLRERGPMPIGDVVALVAALAGGIDHAAGRGVHHGLLHPRDIVVGADTARITGFGIAGALARIGAQLPTRPQYSSPDGAADVCSLGAIAFEAATGKRMSAGSLHEFEAEHGREMRAAFARALAATSGAHRMRARDFADALMSATGAARATTAAGAKPAAAGPIAPTAPVARVAPIAPDDPLDRVIDLSPPDATDDLDRDAPALVVDPAPRPALFNTAGVEPESEPSSRRWPIVAVSLAFAIVTALSVGYVLRAPAPTPEATTPSGVDATTVDLPASAPMSPDAAAARPAPAPIAPVAPIAPIAPAPQVRHTGRMLIRSSPADADVMVNGKPRGKTPLALRDLALGSYTIRVARDGFVTDERTLDVTAQRPTLSTTIDLRPLKAGPGALNVQSRPAGARVFVDNRLAGSTPVAIPGLPAGPATVRIELDGYQPWTTTVRVEAGERIRVAASLERGIGARSPRDK